MAITLILPPTQTITAVTAQQLWGHIETLSRGTDIQDDTSIVNIEEFFGAITAPKYRRAVYSGHFYTISNFTDVPIAWRLSRAGLDLDVGILDPGNSITYTYTSAEFTVDLTPYFSFTCRLA